MATKYEIAAPWACLPHTGILSVGIRTAERAILLAHEMSWEEPRIVAFLGQARVGKLILHGEWRGEIS